MNQADPFKRLSFLHELRLETRSSLVASKSTGTANRRAEEGLSVWCLRTGAL
jgi:hypothetical protein